MVWAGGERLRKSMGSEGALGTAVSCDSQSGALSEEEGWRPSPRD